MTGISFDPENIRTLAAILQETGLTEIEIAENGSRIRVARVVTQVAAQALVPPAAAPVPAVPVVADDANHPGAVPSPMVGVAYLSPEPGSAPYVTPGATVSAGQTVMLIEAMKTFNQIKAPKSGVVARILVASGAPVEYGEVLMIIE